ncbi:MAG TPA: NmrA family NAD(P)-binding protein [Pyrinomonadaceae bacterium]|nr:NmrA family NAD(P)-binding protein [Pyrinomonadaceae bacterium]
MILVLGATGRLGRETVKLLATSGMHKVRALVREMTDENSLAHAMRDVERVFTIPPNVRDQAEMENRIYQAALRAGVNYIVKLSTTKADVNSPCYFFKQHAIAEECLKASGVGFTILRSNSFMQNLLWFAKEIKTKSTFSLPMGDAKTAPVDIRDVAAVAAAILTGEAHHGAMYNISGPEKLSFADIGEKLSTALATRVEYRDIAPAEFLNMLIEIGIPEWYAEAVTASWTVARQGEPILTDVVSALTKKPPISFEQFARDHADQFRPQKGT